MRSQGKAVIERNQDMRGGGRRKRGRGRGRGQKGEGWFDDVVGGVKSAVKTAGELVGPAKDAYGIYKKITGGRRRKRMQGAGVNPLGGGRRRSIK
jgi:hypothetical protein